MSIDILLNIYRENVDEKKSTNAIWKQGLN